jgi:hypothetical protein
VRRAIAAAAVVLAVGLPPAVALSLRENTDDKVRDVQVQNQSLEREVREQKEHAEALEEQVVDLGGTPVPESTTTTTTTTLPEAPPASPVTLLPPITLPPITLLPDRTLPTLPTLP